MLIINIFHIVNYFIVSKLEGYKSQVINNYYCTRLHITNHRHINTIILLLPVSNTLPYTGLKILVLSE